MKSLQDMTLREKIGQMIVTGFAGESLTLEDKQHFQKYHIGNFIYFNRNLKFKKQVIELSEQIQTLCQQDTGIPAFITVDQEGGMVTRLLDGATYFPGNMAMAATQNPQHVLLEGEYVAQELLNVGINFNLAPVLDVNNNAKNPVIGVRSYGDDPQKVAGFGREYVKGLQSKGVIATAKHFPGHGDTAVDSHFGLPVIPHDLGRLEEVELVPFKAVIEGGIEAIMTSHIKFSNLTTDDLPATLSSQILTDLLRERLQFEGLIMTDCMEMKAISDNYGTAKGALQAIIAGADLICISHTASLQAEACDFIYDAVMNGMISEERLNQSVARVLALKERYRLNEYAKYLNLMTDDALATHKAFAKEMSLRSLTILKGNPTLTAEKTLVISPLAISLNAADDVLKTESFAQVLANAIHSDVEVIDLRLDEEKIASLVEKSKQYHQVIIGTYNVSVFPNQATLVKRLIDIHPDLIAVALRNPYDLELYPEVLNCLATYDYTSLSVQSLVEVLTRGEFVGQCPVSLKVS